MGWSHPDISLDDLMNLVKGFVDILILASGHQSSGSLATWDADNIKKAIQWGVFFEEVFKRLRDTVYFEDSVKELDAALLDLTSDPLFPQGLAHMTSATLSKARYLVLERLLETNPLRDAQILALLTATIEMDINELTEKYDNGPNIYCDRLMSKIESLNLESAKDFIKDSTVSSSKIHARAFAGSEYRVCNPKMSTDLYFEPKGCTFVDHSQFVIQELLKRRTSNLCLSSVETGLSDLLKIVRRSNLVESENSSSEGLPYHSPKKEEMLSEICFWNNWRSRNLSYLLDTRTIRLLSGANVIFSAPKLQWIRVFEQLMSPTGANNDNLLDIMEILLLGFISSRWNCLVEHFISHSSDFIPISKQYSDLHLIQGYSQPLDSKSETLNTKEKDIIEFLMQLLKSQPYKLWQVPPVLVAAAIPSRSILFRMYFNNLEKQFNEASSLTRCGCTRDGKEHKDCEVADRIRCLHVFHVQGPNLMVDDTSV